MILLSESCFYNTIGIFVALCLGVITYFKWTYAYWQRKGVPVLSKPIIPYGNLKDTFMVKKHFGIVFEEIYKEAKAKGYKYVGAYILNRPVYVAIDPEIIKNVMIKDSSIFVDRRAYYNEKDDPLSAHLFSLTGDKWKKLRQKVTPTFTTGQLRHMFDTLAECGRNLEQYLEQHVNEPLDAKETFGRFTTDIIASCAFGIECNTLQTPDSEFRKYGKLVFDQSSGGAFKLFLEIALPFEFLRFIGFKSLREDVTNFFMKIVEEVINYRETHNVRRKDFMDLLLQLKNKGTLADDSNTNTVQQKDGATTLTLNEIAAQSLVFYAAGFETSSSTMNYALFELAQNQEIQEKVRDEIHTVLEQHEGKVTYDAIMEMQYLANVVDGMVLLLLFTDTLARQIPRLKV